MKKLFIIELIIKIIDLKKDLKKCEEAGVKLNFINNYIETLIRSIAFILTDKTAKVTEITMWIKWWLQTEEEKFIIEENFQIDLTNPEIFAEHLQKIAKK
jgi:hypothetical protein